MNFTKTFEMEKTRVNRIPEFFKARRFKHDTILPGNYRYIRGAWWSAAITRSVKNLPTRVDVILTEKEGDQIQVLVLYDIDTLNQDVSLESRGIIKSELQSLQDFCQKST